MQMAKKDCDFYQELESDLPKSTEEQRQIWARIIVEQDLDLRELSKLVFLNKKVATRFLWMLSGVGMIRPQKLFHALPFLFKLFDELDPAYKTAFANYWRIAGVPPEDEGKAIDLLFEWLLSAQITVTIKSRAIFVLFELTKKYPELKNEFKLCLIDQMDKYSKDFKKRAGKILLEMEQSN